MSIIRSPLPYQGFKSLILPQIMEYFPNDIKNFIEPFGGGCNVGINVDCKKVIFSELIPEVVGLFTYLKNNTYNDIINYLETTIQEEELSNNNKESYYIFREKYNNIRYKERHPLDFYLLVAHSFSNHIILNRHQFAEGYGFRTFNNNLKKRLKIFHEKINNINIEFHNINIFNSEFSETIKPLPGDYVYCDPPYSITTAKYNKGWVSQRDDRGLCNILDNYHEQGIKWGHSNFLTYGKKTNEVLNQWLKNNDYNVHTIDSQYNDQKRNQKHHEIFITNF
jgi:DNA adenine methylase Dam